jgi:hypothetical protein
LPWISGGDTIEIAHPCAIANAGKAIRVIRQNLETAWETAGHDAKR